MTTNTTTTEAPTPPVKPSSSSSQLGAMEEFVIGCLSGVTGAAVSWFHFTGLSFVFYVVFLPSLLLEFWESYVLFQKAVSNNNNAAYASAHASVIARKRLARQLFGQGVIMGTAGLEITTTAEFGVSSLSMVTYAAAWMLWMVICHLINSLPVQDKIATQVKKQRRLARRNNSNSKNLALRRTSSASGLAVKTIAVRRTRSSSHASRRNARRSNVSVPLDLA